MQTQIAQQLEAIKELEEKMSVVSAEMNKVRVYHLLYLAGVIL